MRMPAPGDASDYPILRLEFTGISDRQADSTRSPFDKVLLLRTFKDGARESVESRVGFDESNRSPNCLTVFVIIPIFYNMK